MAVGEVSDNPSGNAVTRPTVTATRDQDIANKLRIYGIFSAFGEGNNLSMNLADIVQGNSLLTSKLMLHSTAPSSPRCSQTPASN